MDIRPPAAHLALVRSLSIVGPDAGDVWADADAGIALGHRRLSILDLSPACAQNPRARAHFVDHADSDVGDVSRILADTGTVVPPAAPPAMAAAISALLALSGSARRALGNRARARIEQHFTLTETVYRYATLYRDLAGDN